MRVLITRPIDDARELAIQIERLGHSCFVEPLLSIEYANGTPLDVAGYRALIFTSANGARAASLRIADKSVPVISIGQATATVAHRSGFHNVTQSKGEGVEEFEHFIKSVTSPTEGTLLHISGETVAGTLVENLCNSGFHAVRIPLYRAVPAANLSPALYEALINGHIDAALFFSPRTATIFADLIKDAGCETAMAFVSALALSQNVAKSLSPLTFRKLLVAQNQGTEAMLQLLAAV